MTELRSPRRRLFAGFDPDDLATTHHPPPPTTHRVLTRVTERADQLQDYSGS